MNKYTRSLSFIIVLVLGAVFCYTEVMAQSDNLVRNRLKRVALGQADEVRTELPDLLSEFPNDPGVKLLHAVLVDDAARALPLFENIVRDYPQSEWADDAQWRIVQIYALRNDTGRAWQELQEYRKQYPDSEFLLFASELVKNTVGVVPPSRKTTVYESKPAISQAAKQPATKKTEPEKAPETKPEKTAESKPTTAAPADKPADKVGTERYALQVGLYSTHQSAEAEVEKFKNARMRTEILEKTVDNEKKYAVVIGSYSSREAAEKAKETVEKYCNCTPFVVAR